ncbi:MAG: biopolymer transport protein ExbB [Bradymonadia bacterium]|jgi:biopolymer transport protein ExbB
MGPTEEGFSVIEAFLNFASVGAEWVMWLLIGLGGLLIMFAIERARLFLSTKVDAPDIGRKLTVHLERGELTEAKALVERGHAIEERVVADLLEAFPRGRSVVEQVLLSAIERERQRFDRFLGFMGTLGNNAPFIGLLGTVIGIIVSFKELAENPQGGMEVVGPGIAEALVATAVGLIIAIPAVVLFNTFKSLARERLGNADFLGRIVLANASEGA